VDAYLYIYIHMSTDFCIALCSRRHNIFFAFLCKWTGNRLVYVMCNSLQQSSYLTYILLHDVGTVASAGMVLYFFNTCFNRYGMFMVVVCARTFVYHGFCI